MNALMLSLSFVRSFSVPADIRQCWSRWQSIVHFSFCFSLYLSLRICNEQKCVFILSIVQSLERSAPLFHSTSDTSLHGIVTSKIVDLLRGRWVSRRSRQSFHLTISADNSSNPMLSLLLFQDSCCMIFSAVCASCKNFQRYRKKVRFSDTDL